MKVCHERGTGAGLREVFEFSGFYINAECRCKGALLHDGNRGSSVNIALIVRACLISQRVRIGEIGFLSCKAKSRRNPDGLLGFLTQSGRKICRQGGRGEMLNRL